MSERYEEMNSDSDCKSERAGISSQIHFFLALGFVFLGFNANSQDTYNIDVCSRNHSHDQLYYLSSCDFEKRAYFQTENDAIKVRELLKIEAFTLEELFNLHGLNSQNLQIDQISYCNNFSLNFDGNVILIIAIEIVNTLIKNQKSSEVVIHTRIGNQGISAICIPIKYGSELRELAKESIVGKAALCRYDI
jgi:hypothetical protein